MMVCDDRNGHRANMANVYFANTPQVVEVVFVIT